MEHDEDARTFTVVQTSDPEFYGIYNIKVIAQFNQLNIDKSYSLVSQSIDVKLTVSPCYVITYEVISEPIEPIIYTLHDPSFSFGQYAFAQEPHCGYAETVQVTVSPESPYLLHDPEIR